jgi:membrane protein
VQRLFEQTWELSPLSVRNTFNGLLWIGGLALYLALSGVIHAELGAAASSSARAAHRAADGVFLVWSGRDPQRQADRAPDLLPFGVVGAALLAVYSVGATVYVPHLFSTTPPATA